MKHVVLASILMFVFVMPAVAADNNKGVYWLLGMGKTSSVDNVDPSTGTGTFQGGLGFRFGRRFSAEASSTTLLSLADITSTSSNCCNSMSLKGGDAAGLIMIPMGKEFSGFARLGYAKMKAVARINFIDYSTDLKGPTLGIGAQYGTSSGRLGIRVGYNKYSLTNGKGGKPLEPTYLYWSIVGNF